MTNSNNVQPFFVKYINFKIISAITQWAFKILAFSMIQAVFLLPLWNLVISNVFPMLRSIDYPMALGIILMLRLLTRSWIQETRNDILINLLTIAQVQNNNICNVRQYLIDRFGLPGHIPKISNTSDGDVAQKNQTVTAEIPPKIENFDETG